MANIFPMVLTGGMAIKRGERCQQCVIVAVGLLMCLPLWQNLDLTRWQVYMLMSGKAGNGHCAKQQSDSL